jgi:hypothetical protein
MDRCWTTSETISDAAVGRRKMVKSCLVGKPDKSPGPLSRWIPLRRLVRLPGAIHFGVSQFVARIVGINAGLGILG